MSDYDRMLENARKYPLLTEEEFAGYGGSFFAEELGLHVGQDAERDDDIGGIVPFAWQMEYTLPAGKGQPSGTGDEHLIRSLFNDLGEGKQVDEYDARLAYLEQHRSKWGYRE